MADCYRLKQEGMVVAQAEGEGALREIMHYARVYGQDGAVEVEVRAGKRWKPYPLLKFIF